MLETYSVDSIPPDFVFLDIVPVGSREWAACKDVYVYLRVGYRDSL